MQRNLHSIVCLPRLELAYGLRKRIRFVEGSNCVRLSRECRMSRNEETCDSGKGGKYMKGFDWLINVIARRKRDSVFIAQMVDNSNLRCGLKRTLSDDLNRSSLSFYFVRKRWEEDAKCHF
ncbi:hypothetical protein CDAR_170341 [Caerostris darwini]|uniref:Uncharacterized protein n=1 Tax=Caerostris darwini TaxID=1538125 RepID=A0AAV4R7W4_9ARAC|nr:hypothetical protein CDAR_170341 [Caerostris darwini]